MTRLTLSLVIALAFTTAALAADGPPTVTITTPKNGARINLEEQSNAGIRVAGRVTQGAADVVKITVNGRAAQHPPEFGSFEAFVKPRAGRMKITAVVTDSAGLTGTASVTVIVPSSSGDGGQDPRKWPTRPKPTRRCPSPAVRFGRVRGLGVARITCSRANRVVRDTLRDHGRACSPNIRDGKFSRCKAAGFRCYSRYRGSRTQQYACVKGRSTARWYLDF